MKNAYRFCIPGAVLALVVLLLAGMPARAAAASPIVGAWSCTSTTADGNDATWTLSVKEQDGKLTAAVEDSSIGDIVISNFKADGNDITFNAETGGAGYSVKLTVKGDSLEGTFEGDQASGTIKGTKKA
jgi:hypothetical protein